MSSTADALRPSNLELVREWIDATETGRREELKWLLTRPYTYDPSGSASRADARNVGGFLDVACALARGLDWRFEPEIVEEREHRVLIEACVVGAHTGPLDLGPFGGEGVLASTGRGFRLPRQRFGWDIALRRVHRFEVVEGPGLGLELILDRLGLGPEDAVEEAPARDRDASEHPAADAVPEAEGSLGPGGRPCAVVADGADARDEGQDELAVAVDRLVAKHRREKRRQRVWLG